MRIFLKKLIVLEQLFQKKNYIFRVKKNELLSELKLKDYVKEGQTIVKLKERVITAPFNGILVTEV